MDEIIFKAYKIAVRNKYQEEKKVKFSDDFNFPTRAKLRDLCWEIFVEKEINQDDLNVFNTLMGFPFDINFRNKFDKKINKFRPIETFFKGETDPSNVEKVNLAAILVDFQPRPFNKFKKTDQTIQGENSEPTDEKDRNSDTDKTKEQPENRKPTSILKIICIKIRFIERLLLRSKSTMMWIAIIFVLIAAVIYYAFIKKDCMQWTGDHFEVVDCTSEVKTGENEVEQLDKSLLNFKKIPVCDTTTYYKNGEPIIWYSKNNNKVEFFNQDGKNPENDKELRPITDYIFNKYKGDCKTKKSGPAH